MLIPTPLLSCNNVKGIQIKREREYVQEKHMPQTGLLFRERERGGGVRKSINCLPSEFYSHVNGDILLQLSLVRLGKILGH